MMTQEEIEALLIYYQAEVKWAEQIGKHEKANYYSGMVEALEKVLAEGKQ